MSHVNTAASEILSSDDDVNHEPFVCSLALIFKCVKQFLLACKQEKKDGKIYKDSRIFHDLLLIINQNNECAFFFYLDRINSSLQNFQKEVWKVDFTIFVRKKSNHLSEKIKNYYLRENSFHGRKNDPDPHAMWAFWIWMNNEISNP